MNKLPKITEGFDINEKFVLNPIIYCKCGCGETMFEYLNYRSRKFISGHQNKNGFHADFSGENHPMYGKHHSKEAKEKIRKARKHQISPFKGKKHTEETRKLMKIKNKEFYDKGGVNPFYGKHHTKEANEKNRISHYNLPIIGSKFKNTKPERFLKSILSVNGIKYESQKKLYGRPDIFIEPNICIFVDGCFHHGCKKCMSEKSLNCEIPKKKTNIDIRVTKTLEDQGYKVIRIWEHEIYDDPMGCLNNMRSLYD